MKNFFDDLAREIARGTSRRKVLRLLGASFASLLLPTISLKKASAAVTCGTCKGCDLDKGTCELPCTPTTGQTICTTVSRDGSYLRLAYYLTNHGFISEGMSNTFVFYRSGKLVQSALATSFTNSSSSGQTALIGYVLIPTGDVSVMALVLQNGSPLYALSIDPSGRVVQTVATQTSTSTTRASHNSAGTVRQVHSSAAIPVGIVTPDVTPNTCDNLFDYLCGAVALGGVGCTLVGWGFCAETGPAAIACGLLVAAICGSLSTAACNALKEHYCKCPFNQQLCNGVCCNTCMDCVDNVCHENVLCTEQGLACCNNVCCAEGLICSEGLCVSPNSGCVGATCETFVPCSTNPDCVCVTVAEGGGLCVPGSTACAGLATCPAGACPEGSLCAIGTCCGEPVCVPISLQCPGETSSSRPSLTGGGPTIGHR
jgi:hypothetical protein